MSQGKDYGQDTYQKEMIDIREKDCEKKLTQNIEEAERLNMMELEMKAREKEIARLIKRHNLEQQIGVANG